MMTRAISVLAILLGVLITAHTAAYANWITDGVAICAADSGQSDVQIVPDGSGGAIMAWRDKRNANLDIYAQRVDANGHSLWNSSGVPVCTLLSTQLLADMISDGSGGAILVWEDDRNGNSDIYAQRLSADGNPQWAANGIPVCTAAYAQQLPVLVTGLYAGWAIIAWQDYRNGTGADIYAQHLTSDGNPNWGGDGIPICTASNYQTNPAIVSDGNGGAIIAWQDSRSDSSNIYAQRVGYWGGTQWTGGGVPICEVAEAQILPTLASDGQGGAIIAWEDFRSGTRSDVYAQHVYSGGYTGWSWGGISIGTSAMYPAIVSDGGNGAIIAWQDYRSGSGFDIYAQHVDYYGNARWTSGGAAACTAPNNQEFPRLVADGSAGAYVTWMDSRNGDRDVYAQRFTASGLASWGSDGAAISTAANLQRNPRLTFSAGRAIIAWYDNRSGAYDIYAQSTRVCSISPTNIDFGTVLGDAFRDTTFTIKNSGGVTLTGSVSEVCDYFSILSGGGAFSLGAGDSVVVTARFAPTTAGTHTCAISTGTDCSSVSCSGYGGGEPACSVNPLSLDFGLVTIGSPAYRYFTITNTGYYRLTGYVSQVGGPFGITAGAGAYDLGRGDTLDVIVRFSPTSTYTSGTWISTGGNCSNVYCSGTGDRAPHIYALRDVPGDQGGFLNLAWDPSPGDNRQERLITRYTVWRAINPTAAELSSSAPGSVITNISDLAPDAKKDVVRLGSLGTQKHYWKLISSLDAYYLEAYSEVVPTLFDSTEVCTEYHYVQIIAHTNDPATFWISAPDSGRSVDNLAPGAPRYLAGERSFAPAGLMLTWKPNTEADLGHYAVYRGTAPDFVPAPSNLIASPTDTAHVDGEWRWSNTFYYKVSAVDVHGNESNFAPLQPQDVTGEDTPKAPEATFLAQNFPNPFNPVTKITFGLKEPATVSLRIYDAAGRLVRELAAGNRPAGTYQEMWDGKDASGRAVSSGMYFYKLDAGAFSHTKKMVLLR